MSEQMTLRHSSHASHSGLWSAEKAVSGGLLALIPAAFIFPSPIMDCGLALALVTHVHWGVEAIVTDYIRPSIFGTVMPRVSIALVYLLSITALTGLFYFNYTDVGMVNGLKMAWKQL